MIGKIFWLAAILTVVISAVPARADDADWVGIYVGVDAVDGSIDTLSIVRKSDNTFDIRMSSTEFAECTGGARAGVLLATGRIVDDRLVRENVTYKCRGDGEAKPFPDGAYVRDKETGMLSIEVPSVGRTNYYHRLGHD
jgi:hypothetical protein